MNANGLRDQNKRLSFLHWLAQQSADFVCLQETHVSSASECSSWFSSYGFLSLASPGTVHSCGTVLLYRPCYTLWNSFSDAEGRLVVAKFSFNDISFHVVCLYAPNRNPARDDFFHFVSEHVDPGSPTVICGDFNAVFDRARDRCGFAPASFPRDFSRALLSFFGRWKFNASLLKDAAFVKEVETFWAYWTLRRPSSSLQSWLDKGKKRLKGIAIRFGTTCKAQHSDSHSLLTSLASHLKEQIDNGCVSLLGPYEWVLQQISFLDKAEAEGACLCARVRWAEEGEMSTRFFLRQERRRGADGWFSAIRHPAGSLATDISSICDSWVDFYSDLFSAEPVDTSAQNSLLGHLSSQLPSEASRSCDGLLSVDEVFRALEGMALEKSPGSDGLSVEFYCAFWHILGADLVDVLNDSFSSGILPPSLRGALISLIFKKGDRLEFKKWRPISLLNVNYKLCPRALAGRLLQGLHHIISPDQTCGVPGRFIGENVAFLRDLVAFTSESGTPAAILSLDQEKAFERVDWPFLFRTLSRLGFGQPFISWVKLLYSGVRSAILVNGHTSNSFRPSRGVRQGCPVSPPVCHLNRSSRCQPSVSSRYCWSAAFLSKLCPPCCVALC